MSLVAGTRLEHFEILAPLGAGGMGEVYRARDTRLNREVALKVLPASFAQDADRLKRFEQEARATSALNHPNILTVHDIGTHEGAPYIVAELLDGEELRAQLDHGALPVRKAIEYAQQVAAGLAAAHEKGIVHRDLKPENLFVTKDGRVKILDFGLAKLKPQKFGGGVDSEAATLKPLTSPGVVMGTVGYMSPEQVRGHETDHRSDIFSFGIILHEMLAGQRTFTGDSLVELMNAILKDEPAELSETNAKISPALDKIVRRCLEKKPERRFQSTSDLGFALEALPGSAGGAPAGGKSDPVTPAGLPRHPAGGTPALPGGREHLAWLAAAVLLLGLLASLPFTIAHLRQAPPEVRAVRSFILPPEKSSFEFGDRLGSTVAVSPDGLRLAFVAPTAEGKRLLWVRSLDALSAQSLAGTEGATYPFWSPDSRSIGFFAEGKLKRIGAAGGPPLPLCDAPLGRGGTWNRDGVIVFAPSNVGALQRVLDAGGQTSAATRLDEARGETSQRWPFFLPDGEHFFYLGGDNIGETAAISVGSLASLESKLLLHVNSNAAYAQGYLLFLREGTLMAQPFDTKRLAMAGDAFPLAKQVESAMALTRGIFSVSEQGVLAYQTGTGQSGSQLTWFDRSGKSLGMLGDLALYRSPRLSPDGKRVTVVITDPQTGNQDLWLYEVARPLRTHFTFDPAPERDHVWSPDGSRIVFNSTRKGLYDLYQKASNGSGSEELLLESNFDKLPTSVSPDGRLLLYDAIGPKTRMDVWVLPLEGGQKPFPFLQNEFSEYGGQFSPDGRWVAYQSDESRRYEIYVAPFPGPGGKRQISTAGGRQPIWRGKEIFYLSPDNKLMAAEVNGKGEALEVGAGRPLFDVRPSGQGYVYDVTADGQRLLVNTAVEQKASAPITLVLNWTADLKR